jgi:High potential iron-sulfur protein
MKRDFSESRRALLRRSTLALLTVGGAAMLPHARLRADEAARVSEEDATAKSLGYVHDATKAQRASPNDFCHNCRYFKGDEKTEWARCDLFPGKEVKATGWCKVWAKKG